MCKFLLNPIDYTLIQSPHNATTVLRDKRRFFSYNTQQLKGSSDFRLTAPIPNASDSLNSIILHPLRNYRITEQD